MDIKDFDKKPFAKPTVDFAFKRIFGTEQNKCVTISLLNSLITDRVITDIKFINAEMLGEAKEERKAFFDIVCQDKEGAQFIVEMQVAKQEHFLERASFYSARLISSLAPSQSRWDYRLRPTYFLAFLDFVPSGSMAEILGQDNCVCRFTTCNRETGRVMPGTSRFYFVVLPNFKNNADGLSEIAKKWLYLLNETQNLDEIPSGYEGDPAFETYFKASRKANFNKDELKEYDEAMMNQWDYYNSLDLAKAEGKAEGLAEGEAKGKAKGLAEGEAKGKAEGLAEGEAKGKAEATSELAKKMKDNGLATEMIVQCTGLTREQVEAL